MKIHEYQAQELLKSYGLPVPQGIVATTPEEAKEAARDICPCVIKAQVHTGGRGKAGGVKLAQHPEEAYQHAKSILGMTLVTKQTGPDGKLVKQVLVSEAVSYTKEFYLSITTDSEKANLVIIASKDGGTEIEETAKNHPEAIAQIPVSIIEGYHLEDGYRTAEALGLSGELRQELDAILKGMARLYLDKDCTLVEINPLVLTAAGHLLCLDAKVTFDDNALFRHPEIYALQDVDQEDPNEYKAGQHGLSYVTLDGSIGCLVNGAGLAMATMDIIKNFGGQPANFLDVGGSATAEKVKTAFEILLSNPNVKVIFINIFGGIMKCDIIAEGVVSAAKEIGIKIPVVARLEGTNVDLGRAIIKQSGLPIIAATSMADGARRAIKAAREAAL
ncbi:MAG: ADP-forming succinate--CoA ligase subunit beta [Bacilli bacterium]|jgi:succinyl-CoA synthetase beta subunit